MNMKQINLVTCEEKVSWASVSSPASVCVAAEF